MRLLAVFLLGMCVVFSEEIHFGKEAFALCDRVEGPCPLRDGVIYWYYCGDERIGCESYGVNGLIMEQKSFKGDVLDGVRVTWYEKGALESKRIYVNGLLNGEWIDYDEMGGVIGRSVFHLGTGTRTITYPTGQAKIVESYKDGREEGPWLQFYSSGKLKHKDRRVAGKVIGKSVTLDEDGTIRGYSEHEAQGGVKFVVLKEGNGKEEKFHLVVFRRGECIWRSENKTPAPDEWRAAASDVQAFYKTLSADD